MDTRKISAEYAKVGMLTETGRVSMVTQTNFLGEKAVRIVTDKPRLYRLQEDFTIIVEVETVKL